MVCWLIGEKFRPKKYTIPHVSFRLVASTYSFGLIAFTIGSKYGKRWCELVKQQDDFNLIKACRRGDNAAWETLITRYERLVFYVARRYGLTMEDSADITQQTFTTMLESLHVFHADSNLKSWLGTVAKRHSWRFLHRYNHENVNTASDLSEAQVLTEQIAVNDDGWEIAQWLTSGLNQLSEKCRQLLYALYLEEGGLAYDVVVTKLGIARGSIGPTRARCLAKLREVMGEE